MQRLLAEVLRRWSLQHLTSLPLPHCHCLLPLSDPLVRMCMETPSQHVSLTHLHTGLLPSLQSSPHPQPPHLHPLLASPAHRNHVCFVGCALNRYSLHLLYYAMAARLGAALGLRCLPRGRGPVRPAAAATTALLRARCFGDEASPAYTQEYFTGVSLHENRPVSINVYHAPLPS